MPRLMAGDSASNDVPTRSSATARRATATQQVDPPTINFVELETNDALDWPSEERRRQFEALIRYQIRGPLRLVTVRIVGHLLLNVFALTVILLYLNDPPDGSQALAAALGTGFWHMLLLAWVTYSLRRTRVDLAVELGGSVAFPGIFLNIFAVAGPLGVSSNLGADWPIAIALGALPPLFFWLVPTVYRPGGRRPDVARADLLVLRVFATGKTGFAWTWIEPWWRLIGTTNAITSTDLFAQEATRPALDAFLKKSRMPILAPIAVTAGFAVISSGIIPSWEPVPGDAILRWVAIPALAGLSILLYLVSRRYVSKLMEQSYLSDEEDVELAIVEFDRSGRDQAGRYPNHHYSCRGDVWRHTVEALVPHSEVVLMDARGFRPSNAGVLFELDLLVDRFPLSNTVIFTDSLDHSESFVAAIQKSWSHIARDSPNLQLTGTLDVFVCDKMDLKNSQKAYAVLFSRARLEPV